jgi:hypothetical protein
MKIYCNGDRPVNKNGNWINPTFETPDDYTMIQTFDGALDVRVSPSGEVAVYIPAMEENYEHRGSDVISERFL